MKKELTIFSIFQPLIRLSSSSGVRLGLLLIILTISGICGSESLSNGAKMATIDVEIDPGIFNDAYLPYLEYTGKRIEVFYGGAGSGKSVFIAQRKIYHHLKYQRRKTLVIRKVGRTLRHSVFAEISTVINDWDLRKIFRINKGDLEITNRINGNQFIFSGLDDVEKMKSISGITDIWIEEASEISAEDFKQLNLRLRGASKEMKQITVSFNPISALSWLKRDLFDRHDDDILIVKTTYIDNKFLDPDDIATIEKLRENDPVYWNIYGLGNWGVLGNLVYTNYEIRDFDRDLRLFNRIYSGLDWGFTDPTAAVKLGFKDGTIYVLDEFYRTGLDNSEIMTELPEVISKKDMITADSSEPDRIKEFKRNGWKIRPAKKGQGSVSFGIDFVRRHKIMIHPTCQNFINEIQAYSYRKDKDGNPTEDPVDFNNHLMDAVRYALEQVSNERRLRLG